MVFAGTSDYAVSSLKALDDAGHKIMVIYTAPDRRAGRGLKFKPSPVKEFALQNKLLVRQPESLENSDEINFLKNLAADIMVDVAYGLYIPREVYKMFSYGCINVHPSLLPRWRGAAPIPRAILAGDNETGVTMMQVDEGFDTGDILSQVRVAINDDDTAQTLSKKLAELGSKLLVKTLSELQAGAIKPLVQEAKLASYAQKITKDEAEIDWNLAAINIDRIIRAFNPKPCAYTFLHSLRIKIWEAEPTNQTTSQVAGTIVAVTKKGVDVATGNGILRLLKIQMSGGKKLTIGQILCSRSDMFVVGNKFNA